jgi:hypothetical protein
MYDGDKMIAVIYAYTYWQFLKAQYVGYVIPWTGDYRLFVGHGIVAMQLVLDNYQIKTAWYIECDTGVPIRHHHLG